MGDASPRGACAGFYHGQSSRSREEVMTTLSSITAYFVAAESSAPANRGAGVLNGESVVISLLSPPVYENMS